MLGLLGYFQRSIPNFSQTPNPLYQLLKKNRPNHKLWKELIEWQKIQQAALDQLLQHLVTPPILAYPDFVNPPYYTQMHQLCIASISGSESHWFWKLYISCN